MPDGTQLVTAIINEDEHFFAKVIKGKILYTRKRSKNPPYYERYYTSNAEEMKIAQQILKEGSQI